MTFSDNREPGLPEAAGVEMGTSEEILGFFAFSKVCQSRNFWERLSTKMVDVIS